jgi:flagellar L-ring protein FlgH
MKTPFKLISKPLVALATLPILLTGAHADSLWSEEIVMSLISDSRANAVGDIISVIVQESASTKKDTSTKSSKTTSTDAALQSFLFAPTASNFMTKGGNLPAMAMTSNNNFDGGGAINNSETIVARFGVRVVDVLPNKNMIVEGLRQTSFSGESRTVILRGTVRRDDISPANTVFSYSLADVSIKFVDSGAISNSQKKGWFTRAWDVLTPF